MSIKRINAKGNYWNEVQDKAVVEYQNEQDHAVRDRIFRQHLYPHLCAMSATILRRYYKTDDQSLVYDSITHVVEKAIDKFDPTRAKSYSFFQTVIKHFFHDLLASNGFSRRRAERSQSLEAFEHVHLIPKELTYFDDQFTEDDYRDTVLQRLHFLKKKNLRESQSSIINILIDLIKQGKMYSKEYVSLTLLIALDCTPDGLRRTADNMGLRLPVSSVIRINKVLAHYAKEHGIPFSGHDFKVMEPWQEKALNPSPVVEELVLESI